MVLEPECYQSDRCRGLLLTLLQMLRRTRQQLSVTVQRKDAFYASFGTYVVQEEVNMHIYA